jgi:rare lipoprotein A
MKKIIHILLVLSLIINVSSFSQQTGYASFYSSRLKGHHTTDGGKYYPDSMTCAHLSYPLGTLLKVRNPKNGNEVIVKVTDRGPHQRRLIIDVSYSAAKKLDIVRYGIAQVEITKLDSMPINRMILAPISIAISKIKLSENFSTCYIIPNIKITGKFF